MQTLYKYQAVLAFFPPPPNGGRPSSPLLAFSLLPHCLFSEFFFSYSFLQHPSLSLRCNFSLSLLLLSPALTVLWPWPHLASPLQRSPTSWCHDPPGPRIW